MPQPFLSFFPRAFPSQRSRSPSRGVTSRCRMLPCGHSPTRGAYPSRPCHRRFPPTFASPRPRPPAGRIQLLAEPGLPRHDCRVSPPTMGSLSSRCPEAACVLVTPDRERRFARSAGCTHFEALIPLQVRSHAPSCPGRTVAARFSSPSETHTRTRSPLPPAPAPKSRLERAAPPPTRRSVLARTRDPEDP
jgi:hypothetical protein